MSFVTPDRAEGGWGLHPLHMSKAIPPSLPCHLCVTGIVAKTQSEEGFEKLSHSQGPLQHGLISLIFKLHQDTGTNTKMNNQPMCTSRGKKEGNAVVLADSPTTPFLTRNVTWLFPFIHTQSRFFLEKSVNCVITYLPLSENSFLVEGQ